MLRSCVIVTLLLAVVPAIAQPRPRDAVMANAYRCGAIGAPRPWLDCYYGAAQSARVALGMPPVPQAQLQLNLSPPASAPGPHIAHVRDAVMAQTLRCYSVDSDRAWLDCYYGAAAAMRSELGLSPAPQVVVAAPGPVAPPKPMTAPPAGRNAPIMRMASYKFDLNHSFTATLENGQIWRQVSGDTHTAHWTRPASSYAVKITKGAFSSHNFQVDGSPEVFKVDRIE